MGAIVAGAVVVCAVFDVSPNVSGCKVGLKRDCTSGSSKTRRLCSVFLCLSQLSMRCPFCWVVRGSTGLMGVWSLLSDLSETVCRWGDVSKLRGNVLPTVRFLGLGEEFRDGGRLSNGEGWYSVNKFLAGSEGVSISIKVHIGAVGVNEGSSKSKVSLWLVIKGVEIKAEPSSPNNKEASDGSVVSVYVPKTIWLQNDTGDSGSEDLAVWKVGGIVEGDTAMLLRGLKSSGVRRSEILSLSSPRFKVCPEFGMLW